MSKIIRKNKLNNISHPKKKSPNNIDENAIPWPNLPQRLNKHIATHPNSLQNINFGQSTKSWRPESNKIDPKQPRLIIVSDDTTTSRPKPIQFCSLEFPRDYRSYWYERNRPRPLSSRYPWNHFEGCSQGLLLARRVSPNNNSLFLFNPLHLWHRSVPDWDESVPFICAALSSKYACEPNTACALMIVTGLSRPAFMFCKLGSRRLEWTKLEPKRIDYDGDFMRFTNAIGFGGKFYALSSQGMLAVIEEVVCFEDSSGNNRFEVAAFGKTRAIPSVPFWAFEECLVESHGEILLVFLVHATSSNVVDCVEVYRLRFDDFSWVKMESLGERTLFVGSDCCVAVCAEKVGCKSNCVYFMQRSVGVWFEFDMKFGSFLKAWTERDNSSTGNPLEWDKPYY